MGKRLDLIVEPIWIQMLRMDTNLLGLDSNDQLKLFMMDTNVDDGFMNGIQVRI